MRDGQAVNGTNSTFWLVAEQSAPLIAFQHSRLPQTDVRWGLLRRSRSRTRAATPGLGGRQAPRRPIGIRIYV